MKKLRWPVGKEQTAYMKMRKKQNRQIQVPAELWMSKKLPTTYRKWKRQFPWGYRIFDFWSRVLGCAIEIDGSTHDEEYDQYRDEYNFRRSAIVVIRVRNYNEEDAENAIWLIQSLGPWKRRRKMYGKLEKRALLAEPATNLHHLEYLEQIERVPELYSRLMFGRKEPKRQRWKRKFKESFYSLIN